MTIETELKAVTADVMARAENGEASQREIAEVLEAWAQLDDYYTAIQDKCFDGGFSDSVTVRTEGTKIKFDNLDTLVEWMTNGLE